MKTKIILSVGLAALLSACSGGGGGSGSSPSTAVPQYIKKPKVNCGSKDCFSGATVSSQSIGTLSAEGDATYQTVKLEYDNIKGLFTDLGKVGYAVQLLNAAANENDVTSCDAIPDTGTFSFGGYDFTLEPSAESWSFSGMPVPMTRKVTAVDTHTTNQYNFNCDSTVQRLHIISEQPSASYKVEIYSEMNLVTGETHIQVGEISGSNKSLLYFSSNGGDKFTLAKLGTDGSVSDALMATSDVLNPPQTDPESQYVEVVRSGAANANLDTADWGLNLHGGSANSYRGCIANYRSSATSYDHSCNASTVDAPNSDWGTEYALLSNLPVLLVGDGIAVTSWSVIGLNNLVLPNP